MKFDTLAQKAAADSHRSRPKITFILPSLSAGGAERVLITLMNNVDRTRFNIEFVSMTSHGTLGDLLDPAIPYTSFAKGKNFIRRLPQLLFHLRKSKPDIIVSTMAHMNFGVLLLRPFLAQKTRIIVREAVTPSFIVRKVKAKRLTKLFYKWLYPTADQIISPAQVIIDQFGGFMKMKTDHFSLLYNPVSIEKIRGLPQIIGNISDQRKETVHFICAGRLHYQKGFDRLIDSLPFLSHDYDWTLTILGGGQQKEGLEKLIKEKNLEDRVHLKGFTDNPWPHIAAADCFLLPSRYEGLPNVVLESLSVGTPVIAMQEAGGIEEIQHLAPEDAVITTKDIAEFIEAMRRVTPIPTRMMRPSMLPPTFHLKSVVKRFTQILDRERLDPIQNCQHSISDLKATQKK